MCTFVNELPTKSRSSEAVGGNVRKRGRDPFVLFFRPTEGKNVYRFRLLAFTSSASNRDFPFIEKYVHEHWVDEKQEDGSTKGRLADFVTCANTQYMKADGLDYECPICKYGWAHFRKWKESGKKDAIARKKWQKGMNKYVAILPVYVVKDPHNPDNNGTIRTIILKDREMYKDILSKIKEAQKGDCVFNGKNAVDFYASVINEEVIYREGEPNEFRFNRIRIDKYGFTTKPYDLPAITKELVDSFPFDDEYYTTTTEEDAQQFLDDYVMEADIEIPDDDISFDDETNDSPKTKVDDVDKPAAVVKETTSKIEKKIDESGIGEDIDIDELMGDIDDKDDNPDDVSDSTSATDTLKNNGDVDSPISMDDEFGLDDIDDILNDLD